MTKMNDSVPDKLADNEYYHGTEAYKALSILYEGFRLKKGYSFYGSGGTFKQALYLTKSVDAAVAFGHFIFRCKLADGVSILRIDEYYDKTIINSLRREFGKNILTGDITKALPRNKHLKKKELILGKTIDAGLFLLMVFDPHNTVLQIRNIKIHQKPPVQAG